MKMIKTKKIFIAQSFVANALVIYPLYAIMFTERSGLSIADISILLAIWTAAALIFEVPTGLVSDKFPRKYVLISGELITAGAFLIWLFMPIFLGYAVGFVLWGLAYALRSGAYQAPVYDELASSGQSGAYTKTMSRIKAAEFSGMLLAFVSAYLLSLNGVKYGVLLAISIATSLISAYLLALLPSVKNRPTDAIPESQPKLLKRALSTVIRHPRIRIISAWLAIVAGFIGWYEEYTPLFDSAVGIDTKYIPLIISAALVFNILASLIAPRFETDSIGSKALLILSASLMLICATLGWWLPLIVLLAHGGLIILRVLRVLLDAELQHAIDGTMRATVGSVVSLLGYPVTIGVTLSFGLLSSHAQKLLPFRWMGIALFVVGIILLASTRRAATAISK